MAASEATAAAAQVDAKPTTASPAASANTSVRGAHGARGGANGASRGRSFDHGTGRDERRPYNSSSSGGYSGSHMSGQGHRGTGAPYQSWSQFGARVICTSHLNGNFGLLNSVVGQSEIAAVIVAGGLGIYDDKSYDRLSEDVLRARLSGALAEQAAGLAGTELRDFARKHQVLGDMPRYLAGEGQLACKVFAVWGAEDDLRVVEGIQSGALKVNNLYLLSERVSFVESGVRLFGLGGAFVHHQLFDVGDGVGSTAGNESGGMWLTALQAGELLTTANALPLSTRLLVTQDSPLEQGSVAQLAHGVKAGLLISSAPKAAHVTLVDSLSLITHKASAAADQVSHLWHEVRGFVEEAQDKRQAELIDRALAKLTNRSLWQPTESVLNVCVPALAYGYAVLHLDNGNVQVDTYSFGTESAGQRRLRRAPHARSHYTPSSSNVANAPVSRPPSFLKPAVAPAAVAAPSAAPASDAARTTSTPAARPAATAASATPAAAAPTAAAAAAAPAAATAATPATATPTHSNPFRIVINGLQKSTPEADVRAAFKDLNLARVSGSMVDFADEAHMRDVLKKGQVTIANASYYVREFDFSRPRSSVAGGRSAGHNDDRRRGGDRPPRTAAAPEAAKASAPEATKAPEAAKTSAPEPAKASAPEPAKAPEAAKA